MMKPAFASMTTGNAFRLALSYLAIMVSGLPVAACMPERNAKGERAAATERAGKLPSGKSWAISGFDGIRIEADVAVDSVTAPDFRISATGSPMVLSELDVRRDGSTLVIARKPSISPLRDAREPARVRILMPRLARIDVGGDADLTADAVTGEDVTIRNTGAGKLAVTRINARRVVLQRAGSGDLRVGGMAQDVFLITAGDGDVDASELRAQTIQIGASGTGHVLAYARKSADVRASDVVRVTVGGPGKCTVHESAGAAVICP